MNEIEFNELVERFKRKFPKEYWVRWCMKKGIYTTIDKLSAEECLSCPYYFKNGGICHPI